MGSTNHGTQDQTYNFYEELSGAEFNRRNIDIRPRGIYKGGYLTRVSDSIITLSPFTVEIGDDDVQVCIKTSGTATINNSTLDGGTISSGKPYIILRWAYSESASNYLEVHAVNQTAIDAIALTNDIVVGKCVFVGSVLTGFDYTDRTSLNIQSLFLKVETSDGLYVQLRAGRIHTPSGYVAVPEEKVGAFSLPTAPNSRIDLVYIDTDGSVGILQGSASSSPSAPSYAGRSVVAEVTIVHSTSSIPANKIRDVRIFGAAPNIVHGIQTFTSSGNFTVPDGVSQVKVICTGGGGRYSSDNRTGGAGGTAIKFCTVTPGQVITVTVGAKGNPNGGNSTFGAFCTGGGATGATGGVATNGDINIRGGTGNIDTDGANDEESQGASSYWGSAPAYGGGASAHGSSLVVDSAVGVVVVEY